MESTDGGPVQVPDEKLLIVADSTKSHGSESQSVICISQRTSFCRNIWNLRFILLEGKLNRRMICKIRVTEDGDCKQGHILLNDVIRKKLDVSIGDTVSYTFPVTVERGSEIVVSPNNQEIAPADLLYHYIGPFFEKNEFVVIHENEILTAPNINGGNSAEFKIIRTLPSPFCKVCPESMFFVEYAIEIDANVEASNYRVGDSSKSQNAKKKNDILLNNQISLEAECCALSAFVPITTLPSCCSTPTKIKVATEQQNKMFKTDLKLAESNPLSVSSHTISAPPPSPRPPSPRSPSPSPSPPPQTPRSVTPTIPKPKQIHTPKPLPSDSHIAGTSNYVFENIQIVKVELNVNEPVESEPIRVSPVPVPAPGDREPSQSGPAGFGAEWLSQDVFRRTPYFPQMGDDLIYLRGGHQLYEEATVLEENIVTELPPPQMKEDLPYVKFPYLKAAEAVKVIGVEFQVSNNNTRVVQLELALSDLNILERTGCGRVFTVEYKHMEMDRIFDFLVLQQIYDHSLQHDWKDTEKFRFMDPFNNSWRVGTVVKKKVFNKKFPESHFYLYDVQWDGTKCRTYLGPWNMEVIPQDFQYEIQLNPYDGITASEMDVNLATNGSYKVSKEDWPAWGQKMECARISKVISQLIPMSLSKEFYKMHKEYVGKLAYPVDLHLIKSRLDNLFYRRPAAIKTDIESIGMSAAKLYGQGTVPYKIANSISELLERIIGDPKFRRMTYEIHSQYAPASYKWESKTKGKTGTMNTAPSFASTKRDSSSNMQVSPGAGNKRYPTRSVPNANWNIRCEDAQENSLNSSIPPQQTEAPPATQRASLYSIRTRRSVCKVNYSENQSCLMCNKDFYTVEDLENHEKKCALLRSGGTISLNSNGVSEKNSKFPALVNKEPSEDDDIQIIGIEWKSQKVSPVQDPVNDDDYNGEASSSNNSSDTENDDQYDVVIDDNLTTDYNYLQQTNNTAKSPKLNKAHLRIHPVTLTDEERQLPIVTWLKKERDICRDPEVGTISGRRTPGPSVSSSASRCNNAGAADPRRPLKRSNQQTESAALDFDMPDLGSANKKCRTRLGKYENLVQLEIDEDEDYDDSNDSDYIP